MIYERTLTGLTANYFEALKWLRSMVKVPPDSRFEQIEKCISLLSSNYDEKSRTVLKDMDRRDLFYSGQEAMSLVKICNSLKNIEKHRMPISSIKKMLDGPMFPDMEVFNDQKAVNARNFQFELELMSLIEGTGLHILGFNDFAVRFADSQIFFQCKRPQGFSSIKRNALDAAAQLKNDNLKTEKDFGFVALSFEKVFNQHKTFFTATRLSAVHAELQKFRESIEGKVDGFELAEVHPNIIGIGYVFKYMAWNPEVGQIVPGFSLFTAPTKNTHKRFETRILFEQFTNHLNVKSNVGSLSWT